MMINSLEPIGSKNKPFMRLLFNIFVFSAIVTPADSFGIKLVSFSLILILNISSIVRFFLTKENFYLSFFSLVFPLILLLISLLNGSKMSETVQYFYVFAYLLLIPICLEKRINYSHILLKALLLISCIIVVSALSDFIGLLHIENNPILTLLNTNGEAKISVSYDAIFRYVIFLNASPLIIVALCYYFFHRHFFSGLICFFALAFSGTRANIYVALLAIGIFIIMGSYHLIFKFFMGTTLFWMIIMYGRLFLQKVEIINQAKLVGDQIRSLTIKSIFISLANKPHKYIFGMGANSSYYNMGRLSVVTTSELTYLELLRQIGLVGLIPFLFFLLLPMKYLLKNKKYFWLLVAYSLYLVKCSIDPFLFTSTGFMLITLVYFEIENNKVERLNQTEESIK